MQVCTTNTAIFSMCLSSHSTSFSFSKVGYKDSDLPKATKIRQNFPCSTKLFWQNPPPPDMETPVTPGFPLYTYQQHDANQEKKKQKTKPISQAACTSWHRKKAFSQTKKLPQTEWELLVWYPRTCASCVLPSWEAPDVQSHVQCPAALENRYSTGHRLGWPVGHGNPSARASVHQGHPCLC